MRGRDLVRGLALLAFVATAQAADKIDERMREQLRSTMTQMRSLAQENATLKAQLAQQQAQPAPPKAASSGDSAQSKRQLAQLREERDGLVQQLADLRTQLVAQKGRGDDSLRERQQLQTLLLADHRRAEAADRAAEACRADNRVLLGMVGELSRQYESRGVFDALLAREPLTGLRQAQLQRIAQGYLDEASAHDASEPVKATETSNKEKP